MDDLPVTVVGAGPAGLAAAITLGSYDVETLVVERRPRASTLPRATVVSTGTMELLRRWGLEQAARQQADEVEWTAWACATLAEAERGEPVEVGLPTREQARLVSPTAPASLPQDRLEPLLEEHARAHPSVRLERGVELLSLERAPEGGYALCLRDADGRERDVRSRHVIGADGIHSKVRAELAIGAVESDGLAQRLAILFRGPAWELAGEHRHCIYFLTGAGDDRSLIPAGKPDRWVLAMPWSAGRDWRDVRVAEAARWVREAAGDPALPVAIERLMPVVFGTGLADRFREGDAFLAGDAAHRVTPRGGTGLNTAIRDGFDLGWKLAWVLGRWSGPDLLASYERERRPVAEHNTERSSRPDGSILGTAFGLAADIGGRIPHVWVARGSGVVSSLDLLGAGLTLFAGPEWNGSMAGLASGSAPVTIERLDAIAARGVGLGPGGALLVRPDGQPLALSNGEPDRDGATPAARTQADAGAAALVGN